MFHAFCINKGVLQITNLLAINGLSFRLNDSCIKSPSPVNPSEGADGKGFLTIRQLSLSDAPQFRQNLFYLSFLPKTEKCTYRFG